MRLKFDFTYHAPLGINLQLERKFFIGGMTSAFVYSLLFLIRYMSAHSRLYQWENNVRVLIPGAVMEDFHHLLGGALIGFAIIVIGAIGIIIYHYAYHYQGSKSIYLMRRLPNRSDLHRRCLTLPLLTMASSLLAAAVLMVAYYGLYMACTPKECLLPHQWQKLWSVLL